MTNKTNQANLIPPHGGYKNLVSYQAATLIYDLTVEFCKQYVSKFSRTCDQMTQAARSGKQNICEGSQVSGTSKKSELKLIGVARGSLAELLEDYEDFLRQKRLRVWDKDDPSAKEVRALVYKTDNRTDRTNQIYYKTYETYGAYLDTAERAANMMVCLINQCNYLLDRQLKALERAFLENGGFTEGLYNARKNYRGY
ncbi:four helix bundle suffix domain-containing protein [Patescibacteria group bacterium]|nr:four helix bundle suffix domain-containing protein [Patescibacteria group bacterium]MBU4455668.1 four helix bundle suffix domain-containing protein [Patescibacteria group bacterium]MCG2690918.1 four helix bundle suffix domain-containing protein [Candidatus Parcubacteria bacterium]